ncbi:hypothetical protein H310_13064 [Aphanomyces invadans]|uniref:Coiled-coil domain-containing protein 77 n=1 Tax=Aphanomyces invadans TaxID=157072 RepID=A0A024TF18_9STRA|nr:hypothetical protein H310_13064 [Aphanomyces invadans]ETV92609.1 hypothetical protein H310_13064 [Aphanomyces invadans]|eukprot:XP_008878645.1 hypothetical protein H310_13064 [Aphanomyces invadans]
MDDDDLFGYRAAHKTTLDKHNAAAASNDNLLTFYRSRCDAFHQERKDLLERFHELDVSREAWHRTQWQNQAHKQEIVDLKVELARAKDQLHAAEETIATLRSEQESFKIQEAEDRKRIQHLLHLTHPTSEEITFYKDCRPGHSLRSPVCDPLSSGDTLPSNVSLAAEPCFRTMSKQDKHMKRVASNGAANGGNKGRVIRTVYLPSEQADSLLLRVQHLTKELETHQTLSNNRIQGLLNDLEMVTVESKRQCEAHNQELKSTQTDFTKMQRLLNKATKDYLVARHDALAAQQNAEEEMAHLHTLLQEAKAEKEAVKHQAIAETQAIRETIRAEGNLCAEEFRKQAVSRERDIHILKEQYAAVQESYSARISNLQARLTKLRSRYKALESRRNLDMEGFSRDITTLKRHIVKLENLYYGTKLTTDEIRLLRIDESNTLHGPDLELEIGQLQRRYTALAADIMNA